MAGMTERQIEAKMVSMIRDRGGLCLKWESPGTAGVPDRIVLLPGGQIIFVELKTKIGRLANIQTWRIEQLRKLGADVRVIHGWEEARAFVEEVLPCATCQRLTCNTVSSE